MAKSSSMLTTRPFSPVLMVYQDFFELNVYERIKWSLANTISESGLLGCIASAWGGASGVAAPILVSLAYFTLRNTEKVYSTYNEGKKLFKDIHNKLSDPEERNEILTIEKTKLKDILRSEQGLDIDLIPLMQSLQSYITDTILPPDPSTTSETIHSVRATRTTLAASTLPVETHQLFNAKPKYRHDLNRLFGRLEDQLGLETGTFTTHVYFTNASFDFTHDYKKESDSFKKRAEDLATFDTFLSTLEHTIEGLPNNDSNPAELEELWKRIGQQPLSPPFLHNLPYQKITKNKLAIYCQNMREYCHERITSLNATYTRMIECEDIYENLSDLLKDENKNTAKYLLFKLRRAMVNYDAVEVQNIRMLAFLLRVNNKVIPEPPPSTTLLTEEDAINLVTSLKSIINKYFSMAGSDDAQKRLLVKEKIIDAINNFFSPGQPQPTLKKLNDLIVQFQNFRKEAEKSYSFFNINKRLSSEFLTPMIVQVEGLKHYVKAKHYVENANALVIENLKDIINTYVPRHTFFHNSAATTRLAIKNIIIQQLNQNYDYPRLLRFLLDKEQEARKTYSWYEKTPLCNKLLEMILLLQEHHKLQEELQKTPDKNPRFSVRI